MPRTGPYTGGRDARWTGSRPGPGKRIHQLLRPSIVFGKLKHHCRAFRGPIKGRGKMASTDQSSPKTTIWLVVVGIVVLAGVAYVADIYPPADKSLTGSVVPAERYRAETSATSSSRQVLGDEAV